MELTFVEQLPPAKRLNVNHKVQELIETFANSNHKVARVDFTENDYVSHLACLNSLRVTIKKSNRPVKVVQRGRNIYLAKKYL